MYLIELIVVHDVLMLLFINLYFIIKWKTLNCLIIVIESLEHRNKYKTQNYSSVTSTIVRWNNDAGTITLEHRHTGTSTRWNIDTLEHRHVFKYNFSQESSNFSVKWFCLTGWTRVQFSPVTGKKFIDAGTSTNIDAGTSTGIHAWTSTYINAGTSTDIHAGTSTDSHSGTTTNQFLFALEQRHLNIDMSNAGTTTISSAGTSTFITSEHRQNCAGTSTKCAGTSTPCLF